MVNSKVSHLSAKNNQRNIKIKNVSFEKNGNRYKMKTKYLKPTSIYSVVYNLNKILSKFVSFKYQENFVKGNSI